MLARKWMKGNMYTLLVGMEIRQLLRKTAWRCLQKLEVDLPNDPVVSPLKKIHETEACCIRGDCVHSSTVHNSQNVKPTKVTNR